MQRKELDKSFIKRVAECFGYCHDWRVNVPNIQVGGMDSLGGIVFWLHYDDVEINKCSGILLHAAGKALSINSLADAKKFILEAMSIGFDRVGKFLPFTPDYKMSDVLDEKDYENLYQIFMERIKEKNKKKAYFYPIQNVRMKGVLKLSNDMVLYGAGNLDEVRSDLYNTDKIKIDEDTIKKIDTREFALHRYLYNNVGLLRVNAKSKEEALHMMDCFFGALCSVISKPFLINACTVSNTLSSIKKGTVTTEQARINIPSVMRIVVEDEEKNKLQKIFSSPTQRLLSALSFVAHSWTFHERDRFINQVIALDALYGIDRENKSAIVRGVSRDAGKISDVAGKIDLIYTFRNKFVHGEVPSLAKHNKYKHFIQEHGENPLEILFEVIRCCVANYGGVSKKAKYKEPEYFI